MVQRARLHLLSLAAALVLPRAHAEDHSTLLSLMHRVLEGDIDTALAETEALAAAGGHPLADKLLVELRDMARGGYAITNNRSFEALAPLWRDARAERLGALPDRSGQLPVDVLSVSGSTPSLFAVDLSLNTGWLLTRSASDGWQAEPVYLSSGINGAGKRRRGDRRTPTGVYWTVGELDTRALPARYGSRALPLDYPNALDRKRGFSGDGIWLHGIDPANNVRPPHDTDGCVALSEDRVGNIANALIARQSPVVIRDQLRWRSSSGDVVDATEPLDAALQAWCDAHSQLDVDVFLSHYDDQFANHGMPVTQWREWQRQLLRFGGISAVRAEDVSHFAVGDDVVLSRFRQVIERPDGLSPVTTWQRLYRRQKNGRLRIIAQSAG